MATRRGVKFSRTLPIAIVTAVFNAGGATMQARAVRVKIHDVRVRYCGEAAVLVDISRAGALLRVPRPSEIGARSTVGFDVGEEHMEVTGQAVRCSLDPDSLSTHRECWLVGVIFLSPSPHEITSMLHRLIGAHR